MPPQIPMVVDARTPKAPIAPAAPPGDVSSHGHLESRDTTGSIAVTVLLMIFSTSFLLIRIYTKAILARIFGVDDVLIIIAWCMSMVVQITIVYYMATGVIGTHIGDLSVEGIRALGRITAVDSVIYLAVMGLCKWSILIFYLKLSRERWFTYSIYATMALVVGYCFSLMCALIFGCIPLKRVWDPSITEGHCINRGQIYLATAGLNAATDVIMLALPMPMIKKLQVPFRQKIGLVAIFTIGSLTMITSIVRLALMPPLVRATDMSWDMMAPSTWINIEGNLVVVCGCLPVLRLFLKHTWPRLIGESRPYETEGEHLNNNNTIGSSKLSNLSKKKRAMRGNGTESEILRTQAGGDEGSETGIMQDAEEE